MKNQYLADEQIMALEYACAKYSEYGWEGLRKFVTAIGITKSTLVKPAQFVLALRVFALMRNPADKGADGKDNEGAKRADRYARMNRSLKWGEFYARPATRKDNFENGRIVQDKSGAGDWLTSHKHWTRDEIVDEYRTRNEWIRWDVPDCGIYFFCRWSTFLSILDTYSDKGAYQFFNSSLKEQENGVIVKLQEFRTSKRKVRWLAEHSYIEEE